ncbi:hypothetical protein ACNQFZ_07325 [Schinkia sp. CFF1]
MIEKLYLIYNPLNASTEWVSEREFKIGCEKLKRVFGVLYLEDVKIMLHYNTQLKEAIMKEYNITEEKISLHHVCRLISKDELTELIKRESIDISHNENPLYPERIEIKDGYFIWNQEKGCYDKAVVVTK